MNELVYKVSDEYSEMLMWTLCKLDIVTILSVSGFGYEDGACDIYFEA